MKRLILALTLGIVVPVLYTIIAATLAATFPQYVSGTMIVNGQPSAGLIFAPTMFPMYFDAWLRSNSFFGWRWLLDSKSFRGLTLIIPNIALYSAVSYGILALLGYPKAKEVSGIHEPPPPMR